MSQPQSDQVPNQSDVIGRENNPTERFGIEQRRLQMLSHSVEDQFFPSGARQIQLQKHLPFSEFESGPLTNVSHIEQDTLTFIYLRAPGRI